MPRPPRTYDGRTTTGKPIDAATSRASSRDVAVPLGRLGDVRARESSAENRFRSSARSIESAEVPMSGTPASCSASASFSGVWPPNWTRQETVAAALPLAVDDRQDVLERERLEVEAVGRVVVGRDGLGVAVDHHRLHALLAQREGGVAAAVVELDPLADPVRARPEDDDLVARRRRGLALVGERAVEIRRERLELGRAGVDPLVGAPEARGAHVGRHGRLVAARQSRDLLVAEAGVLEAARASSGASASGPLRLQHQRHRRQLLELGEEPGVDPA